MKGHAYIVTKAAEIELNGKDIRLLKVYNPWGNSVEWNGEWRDTCPNWKLLSKEIKDQLDLKIEADGEFFMSFEDWLKNFELCQICNLTPETIEDISEKDWRDSRVLSVKLIF